MNVRLGEMSRVYAIDQRNHGRSPHSDEFNYTVMAKDLLMFMDEHRIAEAHLLGHSMGGKTAMQFAKMFPDRVSRLVVVDIAPRKYGAHHDHIFDALCALDLKQFRSRSAIERELAPHIPSLPVRQFILKNLKRDSSETFGWKLNLLSIRKHYHCVNREIARTTPFEKPALFVRGIHSPYISQSDIAEIRTQYLNVQFSHIEAGHWVHAEAADQFFEAVARFLQVD